MAKTKSGFDISLSVDTYDILQEKISNKSKYVSALISDFLLSEKKDLITSYVKRQNKKRISFTIDIQLYNSFNEYMDNYIKENPYTYSNKSVLIENLIREDMQKRFDINFIK